MNELLSPDSPARPKVLIVDDNVIIRRTMSLPLQEEFDIHLAESGEACLELLATLQPDLVLLDIEMDGIDGHETCRRLRETHAMPVIFVSAHDGLEDRVKAYDSGGDDFIVKPFDPAILLRKARRAVNQQRERVRLAEEKTSLEQLAFGFLLEAGKTGKLLTFMRSCVATEDYTALADRVIETAAEYNISVVVQIRHDGPPITRSLQGAATALEESVIERSTLMGRIFQFQRRLVVNFELVSVVVLDMPTDGEQAGKIRDDIAILAECAEAITRMIMLRKESSLHAETLQVATINSQSFIENVRELYRKQQIETRLRLHDLIERVEKTYYFLGLTEKQEEVLSENLREGSSRILELFEEGLDLDRQFELVLNSMQPQKQDASEVWIQPKNQQSQQSQQSEEASELWLPPQKQDDNEIWF